MCIVPRVTVKVLRSAKGEKRNKTTRQLDAYMVKNNEKLLQNPQPKEWSRSPMRSGCMFTRD